jgi:hypothetical protein
MGVPLHLNFRTVPGLSYQLPTATAHNDWTSAVLQVTTTKPKSNICYDRRSIGQFLLVSSTHLGLKTLFLLLSVADLLMGGVLSDERVIVSFTIAVGPRQRSHSRVRVSWDSWPYFTVSDFILPQPGGSSPRIYIPEEQGDPVISPGTMFSFRRLLRFAGLRWRYSNTLLRRGSTTTSQSQSYVTTDGQLVNLSLCQVPIWDRRPDFYYCQTAVGLLMWSGLSDKRMGPSFTTAADPRQRSHIYRLWNLAAMMLYEF